MSVSLNTMFSGYSTYSGAYGSSITPRLDKDADSKWSMDELQNYTTAYQSSTGKELDAESLMKTYDADGDGYLGANEQSALLEDDGLGIAYLLGDGSGEDSSTADTTSSTSDTSWLSAMSGLQTSNYFSLTKLSEDMSTIFSSLSATNNSFTSILNAQSQANITNIQNKYLSAAKPITNSISIEA